MQIDELVEAYFRVPIAFDGHFFTLAEKQNLWNSISLAKDSAAVPAELLPHEFLTYALKSLLQKRRILIQPIGLSVPLSDFESPSHFDVGLYTSGSSGWPKFMRFHLWQLSLNAQMHTRGYAQWDEVECVLQTLPLNHSYGFVAIALAALLTNKNLMLFKRTPFLKELPSELCRKSFLPLTPSQIRLNPLPAEKLQPRILSIGSSALVASDIDKIHQKFTPAHCYVSYGLTEAGPRVTAGEIPLDQEISFERGSYIGSPLPGVSLRVRTNEGTVLTEGSGQLLVSSPTLAEDIGEGSALRSYTTEDFVTIQNNQVFYRDRGSSLIKKGGLSISPFYIEAKVREISGVDDCFVTKRKSPAYEELPIVFYCGPLAESDVIERLKKSLPLEWWPDRITRVPQIPRQGLHKVHREELLEMSKGLL